MRLTLLSLGFLLPWLAQASPLETLLADLASYQGSLRFHINLKDPNSEHGGGLIFCHGTNIKKTRVANGCRVTLVTAAHCFESPEKLEPGKERLPVTVTYLQILGTFASAEEKGLTILQHPDWKKSKTDIALVSFVTSCDEPLPVVPVRATGPGELEICGIASDHSQRLKSMRRDKQFGYTPSPKIDVRVAGVPSTSEKSPTLFYFDGLEETPAALLPGDSGSGVLCPAYAGGVELAGVLVMAPHYGSRYAIQTAEALGWADRTAEQLASLP